jgi:hypothetical protein
MLGKKYFIERTNLVAFLIILWITPVMTLDRAVFALSMTLYQLFANSISQRDLEYVENTLSEKFASLLKTRPKL